MGATVTHRGTAESDDFRDQMRVGLADGRETTG